MARSAASGHSAENSLPSSSSASHTHISLPSISLPPITHIGAGAAPSQQHLPLPHQQLQYSHQLPFPPPPLPPAHGQLPAPPPVMGSQLPPAPPMQMAGNYYPPGQQHLPPPPQHLGAPHDPNAPVRYALPAPDNRMMSGGRHKKEIKRRTKTGCLTCRKRRIKCDEGHPTCRNCMKSKRECLGYDPIFKAQPGPTNIQPAPNASPSAPTHPITASPYPAAAPPGYAPVAHPYPATMPPGTSASPAAPDSKFDYGTAIDPALEGAGAPQLPGTLFDGNAEALTVKPCSIEDLLDVGSGLPAALAPQLPAITKEKSEEVSSVFQSIYAPGMDKFLETRWFTTRAIQHLPNDQRLCEKYIALIARFGITANNNYHENLVTQSLEAHVIWESLLLCRQVAASIESTNDSNNKIETDAGVHEAARRLQLFESVITNQQLDAEFPNKIDVFSESKQAIGLNAQLFDRERSFWKQLAIFGSLKDDSADLSRPDPNVDPAMQAIQPSGNSDKIEASLKEMRGLLDSRENRDILYSIAIARHVGQQLASKASKDGMKQELLKLRRNSEDDPASKFSVARTFIQNESSGKGTTQVAQRICGMAIRSWGLR